MVRLLNKKAREIIKDHIISHYKPVAVKAGECRYNYKCHMNAVHEAIKRKQKTILMCVYINGGYSIIHFLNKDGDDYYDNTLGEWCKENTYYPIREIDESEFSDIDDIFGRYRATLRRKLPFWVRLLSDVEN